MFCIVQAGFTWIHLGLRIRKKTYNLKLYFFSECFSIIVLVVRWSSCFDLDEKDLFLVDTVACAVGPSVTTSSTWFFGIYLNFQRQKSLKNQYLPHSGSKSYQINSIKSCSSRSFKQHQRQIPVPLKLSAMI